MKKFKGFISLLLCAVLLTGNVAVGGEGIADFFAALYEAINIRVSAAESGTCGDNLTWTLSDDGVLTISGTGNMLCFNTIDTPWESLKDSVRSIVIQSGVTSIGDYAFSGCHNLKSVEISDSVTRIGYSVFSGISGLENIVIGSGVNYIGTNAFYGCNGLTDVYFTGTEQQWNTIRIESNNSSLLNANIAFRNVYPYYEYSINNGEVTITGCDAATSGGLVIPAMIEQLPVTGIADSAFDGCVGLTSIRIPDSITHINGNPFTGCTGFEFITVDENNPVYHSAGNCLIETESKTLVAGCKSSIVPADGSVMGIGDYAFSGCNTLISITIPNNITSIGNYAFFNCSNLENIIISTQVTTIGQSAFKDCTALTHITIPDSVTNIGSQAFYNCSGLESTVIGNGVANIGNYAFFNCDNLTDVYYIGTEEQWNTVEFGNNNESVINADVVFNISRSLLEYSINDGEVTITGCDTAAAGDLIIPDTIEGHFVTGIGEAAFRNCSALTRIIVLNNVKSIESSAFSGCSGLESITVVANNPIYHSSGNCLIDTMGKVLVVGCKNSIIPDNGSVRSIGDNAFDGCTGLTSINIPNNVTSISGSAFQGCSGLERITVDTINPVYYSRGNCIIETASRTLVVGCKSSIIPSDGNVIKIGREAFLSCTGLTSINIPDSVTSIDDSAFSSCNKLKDVYYSGNEEQWNEIETGDNNEELLNATIHFNSLTEQIGDLTYLVSDGEATVINCDEAASGELTVPDTVEGCPVTVIGDSAFKGCSKLTKIVLPESFSSDYDGGFTQSWEADKNPDILADTAFRAEALRNNAYVIVDGEPQYETKNRIISVNVYTDTDDAVYMDVIYNYTFTYNHYELNGSVQTGNIITGTYVYTWQSTVEFSGEDSAKFNPAERKNQPAVCLMYYPYYDSLYSGNFDNLTHYEIDSGRTGMSESYYNLADYSDKNYNNTLGKGKDIILINNPGNVPTKFCVVKMRPVDSEGTPVSDEYLLSNRYDTATYKTCIIERFTDDSVLNNKDANMVYTNAGVSLTSGSILSGFSGYKIRDEYAVAVNAYKNLNGEDDFLRAFSISNTHEMPHGLRQISNSAFSGCSGLTGIEIPESVTNIAANAFSYCSGLKSITVDENNTVYHSSGNCLIETESKALVAGCKNSVIPDDGSVTEIGAYAFRGCTGLTEIIIPDSVENLPGGDLLGINGPFYGCDSLEMVVLGSGITEIEAYTFYNCKSLTEITIPNSVTIIGNSAFEGCTALANVDIPGSVTSIGDSAFKGCKGLTGITISNGVRSIGKSAFKGCSGLTEIIIPDSVENLPGGDLLGTDSPFYGCDNLKRVVLGSGITKIGAYTFHKCKSLNEITISTGVRSIEKGAFKGCSGLIEIIIPDSVENLSGGGFLGMGSPFNGCDNLESVVLGSGITEIESYTFYNCKKLKTVTLGSRIADISASAFRGCNNITDVYYDGTLTAWGQVHISSSEIERANIHFLKERYSATFIVDDNIFGETRYYPFSAITAPPVVPEKEGFIFEGWSEDGITAAPLPESSPEHNTEFTAVWSPDTNIYTITFRYGAVNGNEVYERVSGEYGTPVTPPDNPEFIGYTFVGWDIQIPATMPAEDITVTAGWERANQYTITFTYGSINNGAVYEEISAPYGTPFDWSDLQSPQVEGYTFLGWDGEIPNTMPANDVTINALWSVNEYKVYYVFDGKGYLDIGGNIVYIYDTFTYGETVTVRDKYEKAGYTVTDWELSPALVDGKMPASDVVATSTSSINQYSITYRYGEANGNAVYKTVTQNFGTAVEEVENPVAEGYAFLGWDIQIPATMPAEDITATALWVSSTGTYGPLSYSISDGAVTITGCDSSASGEIVIPETIEGFPVTSIGNVAFDYCTGLTSINIPGSVTSIGESAFDACIGLTSITVDEGNPVYHSTDNCLIETESKTLLAGCTNSIIPDNGSVTSIGNSSFYGRGLENIVIPDSVTSVGDYSFYSCTSLTKITIPDSITSIGDSAFAECTDLASITIPDSVTSIGVSAFKACFNLISITVDDRNTVYDSRNNCNALIESASNTLIAGCMNTVIPETVTNIGESAFYDCACLADISIPDSVTTIGKWAFQGCRELKSVVIPDSVTSMGNSVFVNCTELERIKIGNRITIIDNGTFINCTGLKKVIIGSSVTKICHAAFLRCYDLTDVYYPGTEEQWNEISIEDENEPLLNANIHFEHIHNYVSTNTISATCMEDGCTEETCSECGDVIKTVIPALSHDWQITSETVENCNDGGTRVYTCSRCNETKSETIESSTHLYNTKTVSPTCTEQGYSRTYCTKCNYEKLDHFTPPIGHDWRKVVLEISTCTKTGLQAMQCANCGEIDATTYQPLATTPHDYKIERFDPTCTADGYIQYTCSLCGGGYKDGFVAALPHCWQITSETVENCNVGGTRVYTCSQCNETKSEIIESSSHSFISASIPPSCTEQGYLRTYCTKCNYEILYDFTPPIGHKIEPSVTIMPTCTQKGEVQDICVHCGESFGQRELPLIDHDYTITITKEPTFFEEGIKTFTCSLCGYSYTEAIEIITPDECPLNITYIMSDGTTAPAAHTENVPYNTAYSVTSPAVTGYTPDIGVVEGTMGTEGASVVVTYSPNPHTVTWIIDGRTYRTDNVVFGDSITAPVVDEREGYTFSGWSPDVAGTVADEDYTYSAAWRVNQYTITLRYGEINGDAVYRTITQNYGTSINKKAVAAPNYPCWVFTGWSEDIPSKMPAENMTITAQWTKKVFDYSCRFGFDNSAVSFFGSEHKFVDILPFVPLLVLGDGLCDTCGKTHTYNNSSFSDINKLKNYVKKLDKTNCNSTITAINSYANKPWTGSCYGMSVASIMDFREQLSFNERYKKPDLSSVNTPYSDSSVASEINYYQLAQKIPCIDNTEYKQSAEADWYETLNKLVAAAQKGDPFLFKYTYDGFDNSGKKTTLGHSIVALGCQANGNKKYRISAYDNRFHDKDVWIDVDLTTPSRATCSVVLPEKNGKEVATGIQFIADMDVFNLIDYDGNNNTSASYSNTNIFVELTAFGNTVFTNSSGQTIIYSDGNISGTMDIISTRIITGDDAQGNPSPVTFVFEVPESDSFTVESESDSIDVAVMTNSMYAAASAVNSNGIEIVDEEGVYVSGGEETSYRTVLSSDNPAYDTVIAQGSSGENASLTYSDGDIVIGGTTSAGDEITVFIPDSEPDTYTVKEGYSDVIITTENKSVDIKGSSGNNGSYDESIVETKNGEQVNPTKNAKLHYQASAEVEYRSTVTVNATADNVPDGYILAVFDGKTVKEKGNGKSVSYTIADGSGNTQLRANKTLSVKIIDKKDNSVAKGADGKDLAVKVEITVRQGFFDKLIAFFKALFRLLPHITVGPEI